MIRDAGAALAMRPEAETVRMVLNAQMAKAGPPMNGKDLHLGDFAHGILPTAAPLSIASLTLAGLAWSMRDDPEDARRVAVSFIGEGGTSLGEWHEAINLCCARRLPAIFCIEDNGTALSTPVRDQSAVRVFADKAAGYGIPGITLDGTDPEAIAAAFAWAAERARAGRGPALIELVSLAHVRSRPPRRHALPRARAPGGLGVPAAERGRLRRPGGLPFLGGPRPDPHLRPAARGRRACSPPATSTGSRQRPPSWSSARPGR